MIQEAPIETAACHHRPPPAATSSDLNLSFQTGMIKVLYCDGHLRSCLCGLGGVFDWKALRACRCLGRHKVDEPIAKRLNGSTRERNSYKLWHSGYTTVRNGVKVILTVGLKENVVYVIRSSDGIMAILVVTDKET
uniref:Uncharacterized protein n=1 Tax=Tanacetum cinerariifolium TaxID=118510 RepID=A0A6L2P7I4_TANCI|nr:hypothetical protein [Tanacetum cinerariifolium]